MELVDPIFCTEMNDFRQCRRKIVGWDVNPPDPFPGFGGTVGLGQDCVELDNGEWLLVFHAGYWHVSIGTPYVVPEELTRRWESSGFRAHFDAPRGGRIMSIRSRDKGLSWSKPATVLDGPWDEGPQGIKKLNDGALLVFVNNQASWYGTDEAPDGHLPVNSRTGVMRSDDQGHTWSEPVWLDAPYPYYQRAYAQAVELPDGALLYPTYCSPGREKQLHGAVHRSDDGGRTWRVISTIEREDGKDLDEPSMIRLADGRLLLITRPDAAVFYSEDDGVHWRLSHHAPFAPLKPTRFALLHDGTVVCWMTSHGTLRASWSTDHGETWRVDTERKPFALDPEHYGYPGGFLMRDESIYVVYYDAEGLQQRTGVWAIRFQVSADREALEILPVPGAKGSAETSAARDDAEPDVDAMRPM